MFKSTQTNVGKTSNSFKNGAYRPPQLFVAGTAIQLIRQDNSGQLVDGTGGWWVWGS